MGLTRVYSTLAYIIAGVLAILLGLMPKFGAIIGAIPIGVLGGAVTVLFGMIAILGARIWIEARVDFRDPVNLTTAAVAVIVGAGNYVLTWGDYEFAGIALGTVAAIGTYQVLRLLRRRAVHPAPGETWGDATAEPLAQTPDPRERAGEASR
jgi:xanthine/uracil permease